MKKLLFVISISLFTLLSMPSFAEAAKPSGSPKPAPTADIKGYDVSVPQCGKSLPTDHNFAIVGVNGGTAASSNPCLAQQLTWAKGAKVAPNQPSVQLYVNTANPAQDTSYNWASWPTTSTTNNPYGICDGLMTNNLACSWQYGWNMSAKTESYFQEQARLAGINTEATSYTWWLDVETMNSWQSGSADALMRNVASIEGFGAYYQSKGAKIGLYSTAVQWGEITGNKYRPDSNLYNLPNWRPSGTTLTNAKRNCSVAPLTPGGYISLTQYIVKNLDNNYSCI